MAFILISVYSRLDYRHTVGNIHYFRSAMIYTNMLTTTVATIRNPNQMVIWQRWKATYCRRPHDMLISHVAMSLVFISLSRKLAQVIVILYTMYLYDPYTPAWNMFVYGIIANTSLQYSLWCQV